MESSTSMARARGAVSSRGRGVARGLVGALLLATVIGGARAGESAGTRPATTQAEPGRAVLERLARRMARVERIVAKLRYDRIQRIVGDRQRRFGTLYYRRKGERSLFAVRLDRLVIDGTLRRQDRTYIYDGRHLVERRPARKRMIKRRVEGPLALGVGRFPLPFVKDPERILARFRVRFVGAKDAKPHLVLEPHGDRDTELERMKLWYDPDRDLPVKIRTVDRSRNVSVVVLSEIELDAKMPDGIFSTTAPSPDWTVERPRSGGG